MSAQILVQRSSNMSDHQRIPAACDPVSQHSGKYISMHQVIGAIHAVSLIMWQYILTVTSAT